MMTGKLNGIEHSILIGLCVDEAPYTDSAAMLGLLRPAKLVCRACQRETYVTRMTLKGARFRAFVTCMGCLGLVVDGFEGLTEEEITNAKRVAEGYRLRLADKMKEATA